MAFMLIPKGRTRLLQRKPPHVSISPPGRINLSTAAVELLTRDRIYNYVLLFWDEDSRAIALRPTQKKDSRAYHILYNKTGRNVAIQAKSFFDFIRYDSSETKAYLLSWNEAESAFEIDLQQPSGESTKSVTSTQRTASSVRRQMSALDLADWYTRDEVCERLRISQTKLARIVKEGRIKKQYRPRRGKRSEVVFSPRDVEAETVAFFRGNRRV